MKITARFTSTCPACGRSISVGDQVEWCRGERARHARCTGSGVATADAGPAPSSSSTSRSITVERVGRRSYLRGHTIEVRSLLRGGGCHWDAAERAWWIGDHAAAERLAAEAAEAPAEAAPKKRITRCIECGCGLDDYQQRRGMRFCSQDCAIERKMGSMWSGRTASGGWHQGSDD